MHDGHTACGIILRPHFLRKAPMLTTFGPALGPGSEALAAGSLAGALPRACGRSAPFSGADRRGARGFFSARGPSAVVDALDASPPRARGAASCWAASPSL